MVEVGASKVMLRRFGWYVEKQLVCSTTEIIMISVSTEERYRIRMQEK